MKTSNFNDKINLYLKTNPNLSGDDIGILLLLDDIYNEIPNDIREFRSIYAHLDPRIITEETQGITFLNIVKSNESKDIIKTKLNDYINVKFNYIRVKKSYNENMKKFKEYSIVISSIIENTLHRAKFPKKIIDLFKEKDSVKYCYDFYELLCLYKETDDKRIKFAVLRKIGLIILLSRINRTYSMVDIDFAIEEVEKAFKLNLGITKGIKKEQLHYCLDEKHKISFSYNKNKAYSIHKEIKERRRKIALDIHPLEVFEHTSHITNFGNKIVNFEIRNKFRKKNGELCYSSFVEKVVRKNLEFPNLVRDVIGIRIIIENAEDIPNHILELESFLGGSSMRKKEKNSFNRFGKRKLEKYSSKDFVVWKAIYDVALPHPSINKLKEILKLVRQDNETIEILKKKIEYFKEYPKDFVVEVQLQDINSYLLGNAKGSRADHSFLKMNQIRSNSFFKLFPKEIYKEEIDNLKYSILYGNRLT